MKITETKLRQIIRKELLSEVAPTTWGGKTVPHEVQQVVDAVHQNEIEAMEADADWYDEDDLAYVRSKGRFYPEFNQRDWWGEGSEESWHVVDNADQMGSLGLYRVKDGTWHYVSNFYGYEGSTTVHPTTLDDILGAAGIMFTG